MNADTLLGALIALVSIGGGFGLQSYLSDRRARHDQRIQFERDMLLDLQLALGDMATVAEQIRFAKRASGSWSDAQPELPWTELITNSVRAGRDSVLVDDASLWTLSDETREAYLRLASAASEEQATAELTCARDLLRRANARIGERVRGL
jgi:hypothetical protein